MDLRLLYFVIGFIAVLSAFIPFVVIASRRLSVVVSPRVFSVVEAIIIGGILLGAAGMFQQWASGGFKVGFLVLLFSTLAFIVWSHMTPKGDPRGQGSDGAANTSTH